MYDWYISIGDQCKFLSDYVFCWAINRSSAEGSKTRWGKFSCCLHSKRTCLIEVGQVLWHAWHWKFHWYVHLCWSTLQGFSTENRKQTFGWRETVFWARKDNHRKVDVFNAKCTCPITYKKIICNCSVFLWLEKTVGISADTRSNKTWYKGEPSWGGSKRDR